MNIIPCTEQRHAAAIRDILNEVITNSTALYDHRPRSDDDIEKWFRSKDDGGFPVIGAVDDARRLLGFATYGSFRAYAAFKYTVEHSVYVHRQHRRRGVGMALMRRLIDVAIEQRCHVLVGAVDTANEASIALHDRLGFSRCGVVREAGFKFGRWLDVAFYELLLPTPDAPIEG